ncbi:MAG: hypothetical protein DRP89_08790 [Candidatus Neomarinimicrobiota bacterium]|nr:MAG: hypothetical protein DRP89_08790 [Candidatus Neomarinimicrobiota bacterium]
MDPLTPPAEKKISFLYIFWQKCKITFLVPKQEFGNEREKTWNVHLSQGVLIHQRDQESFTHQRPGAEYLVRVSLHRGRASAGKILCVFV